MSGHANLAALAAEVQQQLDQKTKPLGALGTLERLCVAGYTPMEVITMATKVNARLLQMEDQLGTLETGKLADVLLVEGRPDEDIRVLRRSDHVKLVVQDGRIVKNAMPHTAKA